MSVTHKIGPLLLCDVRGLRKDPTYSDRVTGDSVTSVSKKLLDELEAKGITHLEDREYRGCGGKVSVYASFAEGELMFAEFDDSDSFLGQASPSGWPTAMLRG